MGLLRVLLVVLTGAAACGSPELPASVAAERVAIPALQCAIEVPLGTAVTLADDGATFTTRPGVRVPRRFGVHARAPEGAGELRRSLAAEVSIEYSVRTSDGGSGGDKAALVGALQVGDRRFAVTCHDQSEWPGEPDPTWCFVWLATIRVDR